MKKILIFFLIIPFFGFTQVTFEKFINYSSDDAGTSVMQLPSGEYLVCGYEFDDVNLDYDVFVARFNSSGDQVWKQVYTSIGTGDDMAFYITSASDGGYLICGTTEDVINNQFDAFVLKIQANGTEVWQETYGVTTDDDAALYITELTGGDIVFCGASYDGVTQDAWLCKISSTGTFIWEDFYGLNGEDEATTVIQTNDGGFLLCGNSYDDVNQDYDGMIIRTLSDGTEDWIFYSNTTLDEIYQDIVETADGDIVIVGYIEDDVAGDYDILLMKTSPKADTIRYSYEFDYEAKDDYANRIYVNNNDYYIVGSVTDGTALDLDAFIAKVNVTNGTFIWEEIYGDINDDEFYDFEFTSDNGFICVGYSEYNSSRTDVYIVKTDQNGKQFVKPTLSTTLATNITSNSATTGGNITDDGGTNITARGVCYSTSPNPTIADNKTSDGTGSGVFVSNLSGLLPNTTYYVRAFATNIVGTSYGNEISFKTDPANILENDFSIISIYPNPAHNFIFITGISSIESPIYILDLNGKILLDYNVRDNLIDISTLPSGSYFIKTTKDFNEIVLRFYKE